MVNHMSQPSNAEVEQTDEMLALIVECPPIDKDGEDEPGK